MPASTMFFLLILSYLKVLSVEAEGSKNSFNHLGLYFLLGAQSNFVIQKIVAASVTHVISVIGLKSTICIGNGR
jgi:hypothetical protein